MREGGGLLGKLAVKLIQLSLDRLELYHFSPDETGGKLGAMGNAFRGQDINIAKLVLRAPEVCKLDVTLVDQRVDAEIYGSQAHTQLLGDFALRGVGSAFEKAKDLEMHVLALLSDSVTGHVTDRYRSDHSYRTAGETAPSPTVAIYEQAEASRSFLNA